MIRTLINKATGPLAIPKMLIVCFYLEAADLLVKPSAFHRFLSTVYPMQGLAARMGRQHYPRRSKLLARV
jgi:hypothetical protein